IEAQSKAISSIQTGVRLLKQDVEVNDIGEVVATITGIPVTKMMEGDREKLLKMEDRLRERVVGQDEAIGAIATAVRRSRAGVSDPNRPIGNFFFVGPTGVGKTELAKALATFLFDTEEALIRIDMSEYQEQAKVNTLIGSARGYVGSEKGGVLTEAVRRKPYSVILFDETEKAHPKVFDLLLQVMDEGRLTDSQGVEVDFTNAIVIMTSNAGSRQILDMAGQLSSDELTEQVHQILRRHNSFRPEFLARIDDIVVFQSLSMDAMDLILEIQLRKLNKILTEQKLTLELTQQAKEWIAEEGYEPEYGARPLKRAVLNHVQDPLATLILDGTFAPGDSIMVDVAEDDTALTFVHKADFTGPAIRRIRDEDDSYDGEEDDHDDDEHESNGVVEAHGADDADHSDDHEGGDHDSAPSTTEEAHV
ncbi:MAG: ATP-dependent Clp protease ATP-binding subunit, partial [Myxococcota bacterium]